MGRAFASIQSTKNGARSDGDKSKISGVRGYVMIRMRNLRSNSVEIQLQTDKQSEAAGHRLETEQVALLLLRNRNGKIGDKEYWTGVYNTRPTRSNNRGGRPYTYFYLNYRRTNQFSPTPSFKKTPVALFQTTTFKGGHAMNLRARWMWWYSYGFAVDEDYCNPSQKSRNHMGETVHYAFFSI